MAKEWNRFFAGYGNIPRAEVGQASRCLPRRDRRGQRVTIKFDRVKFDEYKNLLCYLCLQNRTFMNAHLIKAGLVAIDTRADFRLKKEFACLAQTGAA